MKDFHQLVQVCRGCKVYIQTHNFPDPDAIASAFGLQDLLKRFDINATLCYAGRIDKLNTAKMLGCFGIEMFAYEDLDMKPEDAIICVDSQKYNGNITDFIGNEIACIDHHPTYKQADYQYADLQITGACATLIARYYRDLGLVPDRNVATALLYGIRMDTLQFSRGVTQLDIDMFGFLFPYCDQKSLAGLERNNLQFQDLQAYSSAIDNISIYGGLGITGINFSCPDGLIATLSDFILSLEEVVIAVVYSFREDGIKFSVRSEISEVHAGDLVRAALSGLGEGGGHQEMAGGLVKKEQRYLLGKYPETVIRERFLEALEPVMA
ncbi:MAG: DHH family phosphoesterase [Eubacteriales bacterium]|nr:DHH family phosphoesterase [Eubacteriales bacterium]